MKKAKILEEMKAALERYKTLEPEQFNFTEFVFEADMVKKCGTVCCLWGWEPEFGVLKDVRWCRSISGRGLVVNADPRTFWGWGPIAAYLYYSTGCASHVDPHLIWEAVHMGPLPKLAEDEGLKEVLEAWQIVIDVLESGDSLDHLLNLS